MYANLQNFLRTIECQLKKTARLKLPGEVVRRSPVEDCTRQLNLPVLDITFVGIALRHHEVNLVLVDHLDLGRKPFPSFPSIGLIGEFQMRAVPPPFQWYAQGK